MHRTFFPDPATAWVFCLALVALCGVAAWTDTRRGIIPNRLTVAMLGLGVVANVVRGALVGAAGGRLWVLESGAWWRGAADGAAWALAGFAVAFGVMFVLWVFGTCGGGDVKLLAGVGAWVGVVWFPLVWLGSAAVLFVWMSARLLGGSKPAPGVPKTRATYSLPVAVSVTAVLLLLFWTPLGLPPVR